MRDSVAKLYACQASADLFGLDMSDFVEEVEGIITVDDFCQMAASGQIIFTSRRVPFA